MNGIKPRFHLAAPPSFGIVYVRRGPHPSPIEYQRRIYDALIPNPYHKAVLLCLASYIHNQLHYCFPSVASLVRDTGFARSTVFAALSALDSAGYINRLTQHRCSSQYRILWHRIPYCDTSPTARRWAKKDRITDDQEAP